MAFSNIQQIMAQLARQLSQRLAGTPAAAWSIRGEVAAQLPPAEDIAADVPRVILQAGAGSHAISGSLHRCFRYGCEAVLVAPPEGEGSRAEALLPALAVLSSSLADLLAEWQGSPLVDASDNVAAAFCVAAHTAAGETQTQNELFLFRQQFTLVIQF